MASSLPKKQKIKIQIETRGMFTLINSHVLDSITNLFILIICFTLEIKQQL